MVRLPLLLAVALAACTTSPVDPAADPSAYVDEPATVRAAGGGPWFLLEVEGISWLVPYPEPLAAPFREDGLRVVFSGELLPTPPDVRLPGPPVGITEVRAADR